MIKDDAGNWIEDDEHIRRMANQYYRILFMDRGDLDCWRHTAITFPPVQNALLAELDTMVSHEEIKRAMYEMKPRKAPAPDGFPAGFYQCTWDVVGDTVINYIQKVWENPDMIGLINKTDICLIPKVDHPTTIMQFRPISLCNTIYKAISKVMVNILKTHMQQWISPYQTGFVPGRSIHENITIAKEVMHTMDRKTGKRDYFAIKVDLSKAYDKLSWQFIHRVLQEIKIPNVMLKMIMQGVSSVVTNVNWNDSRNDFFSSATRHPSRRPFVTLFVCALYGQVITFD